MLYLNQFNKPVFISILFFALLAFSSSVAKSWLLVNGTDKADKVDLRDLAFWLLQTKDYLRDGKSFVRSLEAFVKLAIGLMGYILAIVISIVK